MIIKQYILNIFKQVKPDITNTVLLKNNIKRFVYLICAINKTELEIIETDDNYGGYYDKKLILPNKINNLKNTTQNINIYIYKIIFFIHSLKQNFYLPKNKKNETYIFLTSLLLIKSIKLHIKNNNINIIRIEKNIYTKLNNTRSKILTYKNKSLLLEILLKKLTYQTIIPYIKISQIDSLWLYKIENITNLNTITLNNTLEKAYYILNNIYPHYEKIIPFSLWGYLYYKKFIQSKNLILKTLIQKKTFNNQTTKSSLKIKNTKLNKNKKNKNSLNSLFDYQKTIDKYTKKSNKYSNNNTDDTKSITKTTIEYSIKDNTQTSQILQYDIINKSKINNIENKKTQFKKVVYKEWDFRLKKYKKNWCSVFEKKIYIQKASIKNLNDLDTIIKKYKKEITLFKQKILFILNKKTFIKRQKNGNLDIDAIIDNYANIKKDTLDKIYTYKKNNKINISIIILIDSSLSTDSYINNEKTITSLKILTLFLSLGIKNIIKNYLIATFNSNTRHDCKYIKLKDFHENITKHKLNIIKITPNGYTRIGPAIRHSITLLQKTHEKKKLILLLSDGNPTDYDEYEGEYGINDIKTAINEANNQKIIIKSIIINKIPKTYFTSMFGIKNYYLITHTKMLCNKMLKIFNDLKH